MLYTALLALLGFVSLVWAQATVVKPGRGGATYVYDNNPRYRQGSTIEFQWTSRINHIQLVLWQEWPVVQKGNNYYKTLIGEQTNLDCSVNITYDYNKANSSADDGGTLTEYDWTASPINANGLENGEDAVLYFDIMNATDSSHRRIDSSSYFNVTYSGGTKSSSSSSSPSPSPSPSGTTRTFESEETATTASDTTVLSTPTGTHASKSDSDDGLSTGAVAGIAVGATLGGILVLGGLGFWLGRAFARRSRPDEKSDFQSSPPAELVQPSNPESDTTPKVELPVESRDYSQHQYYKYNQAVPPVVHEAP